MTLGVTFFGFDKNELLFISDTYRYLVNMEVVKDVLAHKLEVTHENFDECVETIYHDAPKIFKFGKNTGILAAGDMRFSTILTTLNKRGNITQQILDELKQKKLEAFWSCRIGRYNRKKEKIELTTITYENGKVNAIEHDRDTVGFSAFSPEMKHIFFGKYATKFYLAPSTEEKITIVKEFFDEISKLYNNKAGGQPIIARLDKNGFHWLTKPQKLAPYQNFTTYSNNWCPERIETVSTTAYAWSSTDWTDVLSLQFESEATVLALIFGYAYFNYTNNESQNVKGASFRLTLDDTPINATMGETSSLVPAGGLLYGTYHIHSVAIKTKGTHVLKLQTRALTTYNSVGVYDRRLSILKGFYAGGTL